MKYCPNCGEALADEVSFCPECGTAVPSSEVTAAPAQATPAQAAPAEGSFNSEAAPEAKHAKKRSKVGPVIAIVLAVLLAACAVLYFTGLWKKLLPASRLKLGLGEKALVDRGLDELFSDDNRILTNTETKLSAELSVDLETDGGLFSEATYIKSLLDELKIGIDVDVSEGGSNMKLGAVYKGNPVLDATVTNEDGKIGFYVPQLDANYYTLTSEKFIEAFSDGEAPANGLDISFEPIDEAEYRREVNDLLKIIAGISTKENTEITKGFDAHLFDIKTTTKVDKYVITPKEEEIVNVINELADYLEKDGSKFGKGIAKLYEIVLAETSAYASASEDDEPLSENVFDYMREHAAEAAKDVVEANVSIEIYMIGNDVVSHRVHSDDGDLIVDAREENSVTRFYVSFVDDYGDTNVVTGTYDESDRSKAALNMRVLPGDSDEPTADLDIVFDLTKLNKLGLCPLNGSLKVADEEAAVFKVVENGEALDCSFRIIIPEEDADDVKGITVNASVKEGEGVQAPSGVTPTDLSDKSNEEIQEIIYTMTERLGDVLSGQLFGSMF
ncbi:MAG: zinc ribbon domain-containing protein [Clostridia bacterium]|nr:zinc ribbon domain-containing protein [Clostridia bacterium]